MYIIAGLGNPGKEYTGTRHNMGYEALDAVAAKFDININREKFRGMFGEGRIGGEKVFLIKPLTYMNLSGECLRDFAEFYKVPPENIIVIFDDISLPVGKMRIRQKGSAGGHNGIKSIIYQLKTVAFPRIKLGIGAPPNNGYDLADYVLGHFSKKEIEELIPVAVKTADAVETIIKEGCIKAMSLYNG